MTTDMSAYPARDRLLRLMGYESYSQYLASALWRRIREAALARDGGKCRCGSPATQVHHKNYNLLTLQGECLSGLVSVCGGCHYGAEFSKYGKTTLKRANSRLKTIAKRRRKSKVAESPEYRAAVARKWRLLRGGRPREEIANELKAVRSEIRRLIAEQ